MKITDKDFAALVESVKHHESRGNPAAVSNKGAVGTMQTMPKTLSKPGFGVKPAQDDSDAERERVGTDYLRAMVARSPDLPTALAAYNWGPGRVDRLGVDKAPKATQQYITDVTTTLAQGGPPPVQVARAAPPARVVVSAPRPVQVAQAAPSPPMPDFTMPSPPQPPMQMAQAPAPAPAPIVTAQAAPPGAIGGAVAEPPPTPAPALPGAVEQAAALPPVLPPMEEEIKRASETQQMAAMSPAARRMAHLRHLSNLGEMADRGRDSDLADMLATFQAYRSTRG